MAPLAQCLKVIVQLAPKPRVADMVNVQSCIELLFMFRASHSTTRTSRIPSEVCAAATTPLLRCHIFAVINLRFVHLLPQKKNNLSPEILRSRQPQMRELKSTPTTPKSGTFQEQILACPIRAHIQDLEHFEAFHDFAESVSYAKTTPRRLSTPPASTMFLGVLSWLSPSLRAGNPPDRHPGPSAS